jgi:hypothetical protein
MWAAKVNDPCFSSGMCLQPHIETVSLAHLLLHHAIYEDGQRLPRHPAKCDMKRRARFARCLKID